MRFQAWLILLQYANTNISICIMCMADEILPLLVPKYSLPKRLFRLSKPDLMLSSSLRNQNFSVDMRPLLTGEAHGDNKSHSSGIVALDLSDKLRQICYQRSAKIWFVWRIAVDLSWAAGKKWQSSNVVIPTLGLMCLYSSLPTLFQTGIFSPITIHKAQSRINASCCKSRKWQNPLFGSLRFRFKGLGTSMM